MAPVLMAEEPALFISRHADDGVWQLMGASKATMDNNRAGRLCDLMDTVPTFVTVLDLKPGRERDEGASRRPVGSIRRRPAPFEPTRSVHQGLALIECPAPGG